MELQGRNIVIVSNEPWRGLWFSKHHYANELSKNNRVWFIDPPGSWNLWSSVSRSFSEDRIQPGLSVLRYRNALPFNGPGAYFAHANNKTIYKALNRFFEENQLDDIFFLSFDPYRLLNPKQLDAVSFSVYYRADYYTNKGEAELCRNVDLILVIANEMISNYDHFGKPIYFIPHGVPDQTPSAPIQELEEILMMGTLGPRVDFELLDKISDAHPDITLKLVGPFKLLDMLSPQDKKTLKHLERKDNVVFTGIMKYAEVCQEIKQARVCLVNYKQGQINNEQNSLKILQYLSFGKPVVSGVFKEFLKPQMEGLIHMAEDHEQYLQNLKEALSKNGDQKLIDRRMDYARNFRYSNLIRDIERIATVVEDKQKAE